MSFDFHPTRQRRQRESIVPMINVVFLLLIFFLMTSQLTPPEPFPVELPKSKQDAQAEKAPVLYLSPTGELAFQDLRQNAALSKVASLFKDQETPVQLRADLNTPATQVAKVLKELSAAGVSRVELVTQTP